MMTDPIADMLTRIRNASLVHKKEVIIPFSKMKMAIASILVREGYVEAVKETMDTHPALLITLKYQNGTPAIQHIERKSTPGHRLYIKKDEVKKVLNGFGFSILSTPQGVVTDKEARSLKLGGELLCEVY